MSRNISKVQTHCRFCYRVFEAETLCQLITKVIAHEDEHKKMDAVISNCTPKQGAD